MMQTLWALLAGSAAVLCEYFYRINPHSFWEYAHIYLPIQVFIGFAIFKLVTYPGSSLVNAFIIWAMCTMGLRVLVSIFLLQDKIGTGTWIALVLVVTARIVQNIWKD